MVNDRLPVFGKGIPVDLRSSSLVMNSIFRSCRVNEKIIGFPAEHRDYINSDRKSLDVSQAKKSGISITSVKVYRLDCTKLQY